MPTLIPTQSGIQNQRRAAFTLVELLMVIAVIGVLAGITFGISRGVQNAQASARAKAELASISQALEQFKVRYGDYPWVEETTDPDGDPVTLSNPNANALLKALIGWTRLERNGQIVSMSPDLLTQTEGFLDTSNLFLSSENGELPANGVPDEEIYILDPWGNPYVYIYDRSSATWDNFGYVLMSSGPDGNVALQSADQDGLIDQNWREVANNVDNIYAVE
ncbi:MAG: type II secretion system protein [Verrucomicrobiota bacterium]